MELKPFFHLVVEAIEEGSVLIEKSELFRMYQKSSGMSDYHLLPELTQHLHTHFSLCEVIAYETNEQIEVAVSHGNETIVISLCVERWGNERNAPIYYYRLDIHKKEILDATIDEFVHKAFFHRIKEAAKMYIEAMNKYRLYAVTGKGWDE